MDNLTHGLLGVAIGMLRHRDGVPRRGIPLSHTDKAVLWGTLLASELPDMDVFFGTEPMDQYRYHRGWTHSIVAAPLLALGATLVVKLIFRRAKAGTLFAWSLASVLIAHLLNDWMTGWGTRLLLPLSNARLGLDWVPIVDLLYTIPLLVGVVLAWRQPERRQQAAMGTLAYLLVYSFGYRGLTHTLVERSVASRYAGQPVQQMQVSPDLLNPLRWQYVVNLGDRFEQGTAYPFGTPIRTQHFELTPDDDVTRAVRSAPELKPYFDQFAFALITYEKAADGYVVSLGDVRYMAMGRGISYQVTLSSDLKVGRISSGPVADRS